MRQARENRTRLGRAACATLVLTAMVLAACGGPEEEVAGEPPGTGGEAEAPETAAEAVDFAGETIRLVVPFGAGGTFDALARLVGSYMEGCLPGNPTVFVDNVTGGGGLLGINEVYNAEPDGLTIGHWTSTSALQQVLGLETSVAIDEFEVIGAGGGTTHLLLTQSDVTLEDLESGDEPVRFGGTGVGSGLDDTVRVAIMVAELDNIEIVEGYDGQADIYLALQQGEVHGGPAATIDYNNGGVSREMIESGAGHYLLYVGGEEPSGDVLPLIEDVPDIQEFVDSDEEQAVLDAYTGMLSTFRIFLAPPGVPDDILQELRDAFTCAMTDPALIEEAEAINLAGQPLSGEEAEAEFRALFNLPEEVRSAMEEAMLAD